MGLPFLEVCSRFRLVVAVPGRYSENRATLLVLQLRSSAWRYRPHQFDATDRVI